MQINISTRNAELTPTIEEYAMKKAQRLTRYFDRIESIEVMLDKTKNTFQTEIITMIEHHDPIIARAESEDLYAAIDQCVDRATRQLTDHKSKLRDSKHNNPTGGNKS
tara:strand:- start:62 stop:385 length:324 start_codon:yes stop_codon:yes gene_type:complete